MWFLEYYIDKVVLRKTTDSYTPKSDKFIKIYDDGNKENSYDVKIKVNPHLYYFDGDSKKKLSEKASLVVRNYYDFNEDGIIYIKESKIVAIEGE